MRRLSQARLTVAGTLLVATAASIWALRADGRDATRGGATLEAPVLPERAQAPLRARAAKIDALLTAEREHMAKSDYAAAEALIEKALGLDRHWAFTWLDLAEVRAKRGEHAAEIAAYEELIYPHGWSSSVGSDPWTKMAYVLALAQAGSWREADAVYRQTVTWERAVRSAQTAVRHGQPSVQALRGLRRPVGPPAPSAGAVDRDELLASVHYYMGSHGATYGAPGGLAAMMDPLREAIKLRPNWAAPHYAYAKLRMRQRGHSAEALAEFNRAAALGDAAMKHRVDIEASGLRAAEWYRSRGLKEPAPQHGTPAGR